MLDNFAIGTYPDPPAAISPQFAMWTCKTCPAFCESCFNVDFKNLFNPVCYECTEGHSLDTKSGTCMPDASIAGNTTSIIQIIADEYEIQRCDDVKMKVQGPSNPLPNVQW